MGLCSGDKSALFDHACKHNLRLAMKVISFSNNLFIKRSLPHLIKTQQAEEKKMLVLETTINLIDLKSKLQPHLLLSC